MKLASLIVAIMVYLLCSAFLCAFAELHFSVRWAMTTSLAVGVLGGALGIMCAWGDP